MTCFWNQFRRIIIIYQQNKIFYFSHVSHKYINETGYTHYINFGH